VAVLYIPTFSDYFWNDEIMELFKDEGYQFYALELRRYGRSLKLDQGQHPNLCYEVCEYYEEIGKAIHIMRIFDGMEKLLLVGLGSGAIIAANYINDHNELVDGFLAISPLVALHTAFPGRFQ
jgi:alpha-beta hydrolase superfamily lysophospholipase